MKSKQTAVHAISNKTTKKKNCK